MKIYVHAASDFDNMTYQEFKSNPSYKAILKKFPDLLSGFGATGYTYQLTKKEYEKVGSRWKLVDSETRDVSFENYMNVISAGPFFKNLGGRETLSKSYTPLGYVPVEVNSISPDGTQKSVWSFRIDYKGR